MIRVKRKMVLSLIVAMMVVGTTNAYAANSSTAQISSEKKASSIQEEINKLQNNLKPGQMIAYYVPDKKFNPLGRISFAGKGYVAKEYKSHITNAQKLNAPALTMPSNPPKGYQFKSGVVYLKDPSESSTLYKSLEQELKAQAEKGSKQIYTKSVKVTESLSVVLQYVKGKTEVDLVATYMEPSKPIDGTPVLPNLTAETIKINGVECTYTTDSKGKDSLSWYDEDNQTRYTIWAESAKSDVLRFAKLILED